jgi:hypothetical protein
MYPESEILFPSRCIPQLRDLRGHKWAELVDHVITLPDGHEDVLGFSLMIIKMASGQLPRLVGLLHVRPTHRRRL